MRRAFLCGVDRYSGKDFDHRKVWVRERLEELAAIFAVDILGFSIMSNHMHVLLRNRPDVARDWSGEDIARRWWRLHPITRLASSPSWRASNRGFLPLTLDEYLELLDWTGRQVRTDKRGAIPAALLPILERLQINAEAWVDTIEQFGRRFRRAIGRASSMTAFAGVRGKCWFQGLSASRMAFG